MSEPLYVQVHPADNVAIIVNAGLHNEFALFNPVPIT